MTAPYLGDFNEDQEVVFHWDTNNSDGASITRATDGTIKVRRGDGTDCTGTSVTDTEDTPDTGLHECKVDTSDGANYTTGYDYTIWLDGAVIDGQTVNAVLAMFSIENRFAEVDVTKIHGSALTETSPGYLAAAFVKLFDVVTPLLVSSTVMRGTDSASTHDAAGVKTALEADGSKLDHLWEMTEDDGGTRRLTTNALEQGDSGNDPGVWR